MFCNVCSGLLLPSNGKLYCSECKTFFSKEFTITSKTETKKKMLEEATDGGANPEVAAKCRKCGNRKAFFAFKQTRASDEAPTKFFKCTKCGAAWRQYD
ncbi:MAG: transcription factor S [Nanoarchaeota archaeon]|nr:transcription factor S [Nanoarchaeota archaeon]